MDNGQTRFNRYKYFQSFEFKNHKALTLFVQKVKTFIFVESIIPNGKGGLLLFITSDRIIKLNGND